MSIDNYFIQKDGKWISVNSCDIEHETNRTVGHCAGNFQTDFWVDIQPWEKLHSRRALLLRRPSISI